MAMILTLLAAEITVSHGAPGATYIGTNTLRGSWEVGVMAHKFADPDADPDEEPDEDPDGEPDDEADDEAGDEAGDEPDDELVDKACAEGEGAEALP